MKLDQLRAFVAVANTLNMTRAAAQLHLTQPAISASISTLEERYGTRLFDRIGRRLELTQAGRLFLPEAQAVLNSAESATRLLDDLSGLLTGELRLAASQTVATYWLPPRMAGFSHRFPAIALPLKVGNTAQAVKSIIEGDAELGFIEGKYDNARIRSRIIGGDALGLYTAPHHPLARSPLNKDALNAANWVVREAGSGTREHFISNLSKLGLDFDNLDLRLELPSNGAVLEAIQMGGLVAAVSDLAARSRLDCGLITRLNYSFPRRTFRCIMHKERYLGPAAQAFLSSVDCDPLQDVTDT